MLDEVRSWSQRGWIDTALRDRLVHPYEAEIEAIAHALDVDAPIADRPAPPHCHAQPERSCAFCPDCGVSLAAWQAQPVLEVPRALDEVLPRTPPLHERPAVSTTPSAEPEPAPEPAPAPAPRRAERLLRELRPVFYENLILFVGAFLVFAGSVYFAVYFWERLGQFGPLVAGGLLAAYGLGFAATGYLLQRRYHADLSARVLYGVATAILPVASTLLGDPIRTGGAGVGVLAAVSVAVLGAATYPAILTAASLFQREIGRPFARAYVTLLWAIGLAPLATTGNLRWLGIVYAYLSTVPVLAMYRRAREVGRVFERATIVYIVGGSAYMVLGVAARLSLVLSPGLAPAEVAPLLVLIATAAIDLDVAWRQQSHAARSALGVVGVLAHGAAVVAIVMASADPRWRVPTTLSAGMVFAVTALRHRRPSAIHLAIVTVAASGLMVAWLPVFDPPGGVAFGGLLLLPLSAGLARLGARWRRHAAVEFAAPCELWVTLCPILAALGTLLPLLGPAWQLASLGRWSAYVPALVVLPSSAAVLALAWSWGHRRPVLAGAAIAAAATVLVVAHMAGAEEFGLAVTSAGLTLVIAAAAFTRRGDGASAALLDAALVLLSLAVVLLSVAWVGPWNESGVAVSVGSFALVSGAAVAVAAQRPRREVGVVAVLGVTVAAAAGLWALVPHDLIPGVLAVALLGLDHTKADVEIGKARPFRDAYAIALAAVALQVITIFATTPALEAVSPPGSALVALALLAIAARHRSPWPTYGAVGWLVAAAYGTPAALDLAISPRIVVEGAGLVVIAIALGLRRWPRLQGWRTTFLDVPLHLAAAAAPLALLRFLLSFADWELSEGPETHVLLRRLASPLGCAVLAAITHGSRVHAYLAAVAGVFVLPAVAAALGFSVGAVGAALAGAGVLALAGSYEVARRPAFAAPVARGDLPLRLFAIWDLPSAATRRDLWLGPIGEIGLLAALAAWGMSVQRTVGSWPDGAATPAVAYGLLAVYAITRCVKPVAGDARAAAVLAAHAACATLALLATEVAHLLGRQPHGEGPVLLGAGFLLVSEILARGQHPAERTGARAAVAWAIVCLVVPITLLLDVTDPTTPAAAAILAVAVVRYGQRYRPVGIQIAASVAATAALGFVVLWLLGLREWLQPEGVALAALAITAAAVAWAHWLVRDRARLGQPFGLASFWALVGGVLAVAAGGFEVPASAPVVAPTLLAIATLVLAAAWFAFAAIRTAQDRYGYAALIALVLLYACLRTGPDGAALSAEIDVIVAIAAAFALHFSSELLRRAQLTALARPAVLGARLLPVGACVIALWSAGAGAGELSTLPHAALAELLGVLYTLGFRRGGHRALGFVALCFYNLGLALLWIYTDRQDALYYIIPLGVSISLLARIYGAHMSRTARRGLRAAGALLIYFSTYYQVVQFDQGLYPVLLGGLTLAGIALGFILQLRELFVLSIGFLVLDVISNLAYYGVHRPVLGWTLLTLAGLCLIASGIVFQLRRAQVRGLVGSVRATLAEWD